MSIKLTVTGNVNYGVDFKCEAIWSDTPSEGQLELFAKLLRSWFTVGMNGAYGGDIHYVGDVKTEGKKSIWYVDMGTADADKAFSELAKLLDNFSDNKPFGFQEWQKIENLICGD